MLVIGAGALMVAFQSNQITVGGTLVLQPHPPTGKYTITMMVWTLQTEKGKTYYLLDAERRLLGSTEDGVFVEGAERVISGYTIVFESYDGNQTYDGLVVKTVGGFNWGG